MRYGITWTQTTTYRSEVTLSTEELAAWATRAAAGVLYASTLEALSGTSAEQLVELIDRNSHLRDRLLALYIEQTLPAATPATTQLSVVDVQPLNHVDDPSNER